MLENTLETVFIFIAAILIAILIVVCSHDSIKFVILFLTIIISAFLSYICLTAVAVSTLWFKKLNLWRMYNRSERSRDSLIIIFRILNYRVASASHSFSLTNKKRLLIFLVVLYVLFSFFFFNKNPLFSFKEQ